MRRIARLLPRLLLVLAVLAAPAIIGRTSWAHAAVMGLVDLIRDSGPLGILVYAAACAVGAVLVTPVSFMAAIAGYAYGFTAGLLLAQSACLLGATAAFLVGRTVLRPRLFRSAGRGSLYRAVQRAVDDRGLRVAVLLRLSPVVPQSHLNYALGLSRLPARHFVAATFLGFAPMVCLSVYVGSMVRSVTELSLASALPSGPWAWAAAAVGVILVVAAAALVTRAARNSLESDAAA